MIKNNFQVTAGREARFSMNPLLSTLLFIVLFIAGELLAVPFTLLSSYLLDPLTGMIGHTINFTFSNLIIPFGIVALFFMAFVKWIEKRPVVTLGFSKANFKSKYVKGFAIGVLMMFSYMAIALATGTLKVSELSFQWTNVSIWIGVLIVLPGWIIQGASEEIITRGWLYQSASAKYGGFWGLLIAPTIFGVLHIFNDNITFLSMLNLVLFGVFAVFYLLADGGLWGICALHTSWNWAQGNLLGIPVSGSPIIGGSLLKPGSMHGPDFMTGAGFGAEGSVIVTGILIVGIIYLIYAIKKRPI